jgi:hypothetical protein
VPNFWLNTENNRFQAAKRSSQNCGDLFCFEKDLAKVFKNRAELLQFKGFSAIIKWNIFFLRGNKYE